MKLVKNTGNHVFRPIFDLFYPQRSIPTLDLCLIVFNVFGVQGPLGGLLLLNSICNAYMLHLKYSWTHSLGMC